ncbi:MAG: thiamine phosphate synthase [Sphingomonadales bacterium]
MFFTDAARAPDTAAAITMLPAGCGVVLRDYQRPQRANWARRMISLCRRQGRLVLLAGDARLALALGADGVHYPAWALTGGQALRRPKKPWLVSAAAHDRAEALRAARAGADLLVLSPVFATKSHPHGQSLGPLRLGLLRRGLRPPTIGLGGIGPANACRLHGLGLVGYAAIESLIRP